MWEFASRFVISLHRFCTTAGHRMGAPGVFRIPARFSTYLSVEINALVQVYPLENPAALTLCPPMSNLVCE
jgi:hypothetical protein